VAGGNIDSFEGRVTGHCVETLGGQKSFLFTPSISHYLDYRAATPILEEGCKKKKTKSSSRKKKGGAKCISGKPRPSSSRTFKSRTNGPVEQVVFKKKQKKFYAGET